VQAWGGGGREQERSLVEILPGGGNSICSVCRKKKLGGQGSCKRQTEQTKDEEKGRDERRKTILTTPRG